MKRVIRVLVRLLPRTVRKENGEDLSEFWAEQAREGRYAGALGRARLVLGWAWDAVGLSVRAVRAEGWGQDLRYGFRALARQPRFALVSVLTLGLGAAGATTVFSVVNAVLLKPLPYPRPQELVAVSTVWAGKDAKDQMAPPDVEDLQARVPSLASLVGYQTLYPTLTGMGDAEVVQVARVSQGLMGTLGLPPALGRDIRKDEAGYGGQRVAVVSHRFWQERMGSAPDAIGRTVRISGASFVVVGVGSESFDFPAGTQIWVPHVFSSPTSCARACHTWETVGRLREGVALATAQAEVAAAGRALAVEYADTNARKGFVLEDLARQGTGPVRTRLWLIAAAVGLLLAIACANTAGLLLMRMVARRGEMAVRCALGSSRRRLAGLVVGEAAILAGAAGLLGVLVALGSVDVIRSQAADFLPRSQDVAVDGWVLLFSLVLVAVVAVASSVAPILSLDGLSPLEGMASQSRRSLSSGVGRTLRHGLISLQIALSVILLGGAGLLVRSLARLHAVDPGFDSAGIVRFDVTTRGNLEEVRGFYRNLEERLRGVPGVQQVASVFGAPLGRYHVTARVQVEDRGGASEEDERTAGVRAVGPGYLEMMEIPLVTGRGLLPSDDTGEDPVAVVNESFVREVFPGEEPVGRRVKVLTDQGFGSPVWTIVGVVRDIRSEGLDREPIAEIYVPQGRFGPSVMTVQVRASVPPDVLIPALRDVLRSVDPNLPLRNLETLDDVVRRALAPTRFLAVGGVVFSAFALLLSMVGLYGALAFLTLQRTREIGLRLALGASRKQVLNLVLREGLTVTATGVVVGIAVFLWVSRALGALLYQVQPWDPGVFFLVVGVLLACALAAGMIPAWRASRVPPMVPLRQE